MRILIRIIFLAIAIVFALQIIPSMFENKNEEENLINCGADLDSNMAANGRTLVLVLPALSPVSAISSALASRSLAWVSLLALPVLIMSVFKGRWFCFRLCPTGLLAEFAGKLRPGSKSKFMSFPKAGDLLMFVILGGSIVGYPLFIWLDPLCMLNGFFASFRSQVSLVSILPATGLIFIVLLSLWRPHAWCYRFCPLGFSQELLGKAWRHFRQRNIQSNILTEAGSRPERGFGRRIFMALIVGGISAFFARVVFGKNYPIRPPGAVAEDKFTGLCCRCGSCVNACPKNIIVPDTGQSGFAGFLTPVLRISSDYCVEWCNECTKVCPTGAISRLSLSEKNDVLIGTAVVNKRLCLSWEKGQACMVCNEYCAYRAVKVVKNGAVSCPEVDPETCRGCGYCQIGCPAENKAIIVSGKPQRKLKHVQLQRPSLSSHGQP